MPARHPATFLRCEPLEDRAVPALFGNPWPDAGNLTLSFVPDGTDVAGEQSALEQTLGRTMPAAAWQEQILRAFQTWNQFANINLTLVTDNGSPVGAPAPVQGSLYTGDIRVSARPLSDNVLAVSTPFNLFSNWSGEIVFNSTKDFGSGPGQYDLYTVALQEAGHALGLDNSSVTASAMFTTYSTPRTGLAAADIAAIQALYGPRSVDRFDAAKSNDVPTSATAITYVKDSATLDTVDGTEGDKPLVAAGDLTTLMDVDSYAFKNPKGSSDFYVSVRTDVGGQLNARVSVLGPDNRPVSFLNQRTGQSLTSAVVSASSREAFLIKVENAKSDATYRVIVEGATEDVFGVGPYRLAAGNDPHERLRPELPTGYLNQDGGRNETRDKATNLGSPTNTTDARWDFTQTASLYNGSKTDVDWYKVKSPKNAASAGVFMVTGLVQGELDPSVEVYTRDGVRLAAEVLSSTGGTEIVQVTGLARDTEYFVRVAAASPDVRSTGNYLLAVDFRDTPVALATLAEGTLQGATNEVLTTFTLARSQSLWFELSGQAGVEAAARLTVYDAANQAIFTTRAKGGETSGGSVLLAPGSYTVRIVAAGADGAPLPAFGFRARYDLGSDPIGVQPLSPTAPAATTPPPVWTPTSTSGTYDPFLGGSGVYTPPAGGGVAGVITWGPFVPTPTFATASYADLYSDPWW